RKRIKGIHAGALVKGAGAAALATLFMGAVLLGWLRITASHSAALTALGGVVIGGAVYAAVLVALRIPEVGSLIRMLKRWLSR
ncbi:MAG TPA: hypothetical protein VF359_07510, partial [Anaerolineales bacterium]